MPAFYDEYNNIRKNKILEVLVFLTSNAQKPEKTQNVTLAQHLVQPIKNKAPIT